MLISSRVDDCENHPQNNAKNKFLFLCNVENLMRRILKSKDERDIAAIGVGTSSAALNTGIDHPACE